MGINITKEIKFFIEFLNLNWDFFDKTLNRMHLKDEMQKADIINDWYQFNWEIYLESVVCSNSEFLVEYGAGADCNVDSDRVRFPLNNANNKIVCKSKEHSFKDYLSGKNISLKDKEFYKFVSFDGTNYSDSTPFDYTLLEDVYGEYSIIKNTDIEFYLHKFDNESE